MCIMVQIKFDIVVKSLNNFIIHLSRDFGVLELIIVYVNTKSHFILIQ
jgi:hypothetical protein